MNNINNSSNGNNSGNSGKTPYRKYNNTNSGNSGSRSNYRSNNHRKPSKSLIFLKSTVVSLGLILVVLLVIFFFIKKNQKHIDYVKCSGDSKINVSSEIQDIKIDDKKMIILTKYDKKSKSQEIITLKRRCGTVISRVKLNINR